MNALASKLLIQDEAMRLKPYKDKFGKTTIGVGRNLDDMGITFGEAMAMLAGDLNRCEVEAQAFHWYGSLSIERQAVILCMLFNMGLTRFMGFHKFMDAIESEDYHEAALEMTNSRWAVDVGDRATRLAELMRMGIAK